MRKGANIGFLLKAAMKKSEAALRSSSVETTVPVSNTSRNASSSVCSRAEGMLGTLSVSHMTALLLLGFFAFPSCSDAWKIASLKKAARSEEHTSELQSRFDLVCRLLLEKKKTRYIPASTLDHQNL